MRKFLTLISAAAAVAAILITAPEPALACKGIGGGCLFSKVFSKADPDRRDKKLYAHKKKSKRVWKRPDRRKAEHRVKKRHVKAPTRKRVTRSKRARDRPAREASASGAFGWIKTAARGSSGGSARHINVAKRYVGRNPTGRRSLWCADFVNLVERKNGRSGTGSRLAKSYLSYGRRVHNPRPGDIAVYSRGGNKGHVAYVYKVSGGKVAIIGGNQCGRRGSRTVCVSWRSKHAAISYRRV